MVDLVTNELWEQLTLCVCEHASRWGKLFSLLSQPKID